jgi:hypothetical protein
MGRGQMMIKKKGYISGTLAIILIAPKCRYPVENKEGV